MDYQQIALEVFNNKESYKDDDYIVILNILMESYNKSKGIHYEVNRDLKQEEIELNECLNCGAEQEERCDDCGGIGILMYDEDLCHWCAYEQDSE